MDIVDNAKLEYPPLLKALLAVVVLFLGSLGLLFLSLILNMVGFGFGLGNLLNITFVLEQIGILMLGVSILLGGAVSIFGLTMRTLTLPTETLEKQKNEDHLYDIREHGLSVEEILGDMTMSERELLAEKLAESRLAIREDGTLIPLEQAEKLNKVERFSNG